MTSKPIIEITGTIGIDTTYEMVNNQLQECTGDIEVHIDSPGGYAYTGIAIYNALRNYQGGKVGIVVCGLAASIASYIMLAGDELSLLESAAVMIHNPSTTINGDYRTLQDSLRRNLNVRQLMASAYAQRLHTTLETVEQLMDAETFYLGKEELQRWGKVIATDQILPDKMTAQLQVHTALAVLTAEQESQQLEQLAAYLPPLPDFTNPITNNQENLIMETLNNLNDLKNKYPELYAQALEEGRREEHSRVVAHLEFIDIAKDTALDAIKDHTVFTNNSELQAKYLKAKLNQAELTAMVNNNPPAIVQAPIDEAQAIRATQTAQVSDLVSQIKTHMKHY